MILGAFHSIFVGTIKWNGPFWFGPSEILGSSFEWSSLTGPVMSVGRTEMSLSICQIVVPSTAVLCLLYPAYKNNNQTRVCATGMYREMGT